MHEDARVYEHPIISAHARRLLTVLVAVGALVLALLGPARAAVGTGIEGTVTGPGGIPVDGVVYVLVDDPEWGWDLVDAVTTDGSGHYEVETAPGSYALYFFDLDEEYQSEVYDNAADLEDATPVPVTAGNVTTIDAELAPMTRISGDVTLSPGDRRWGAVRVLDAATGDLSGVGYVEDDGSYQVSGLAPGSYKVAFNRLSGFAYSAPEFYDDVAEADGVGAADTIVLTEGQHRTGVDAVLVEGGHVTGTLTDTDGDPLRCLVQAFTTDGSLVTRAARSDATTGAFDVTGLSSGSYLLRVVRSGDCNNGAQFLVGTGGPLGTTVAEADPVATTQGTETPLATTLQYDLGPPITNVTPPSVAGTPAVGVQVRAQPGDWTPAPGSYRYQWLVDGVPVRGATRARFTPEGPHAGTALTVRVTARLAGHRATAATSAPVTVPRPGPVAVSPPRLSGPPQVGRTITATSPGVWSQGGLSFTYTWSTGTTVHQSSTDPAFVVPEGAFRWQLLLQVAATGSDAGAGQAVIYTAPVAAGDFKVARKMRLKGPARVGSTLRLVDPRLTPAPTATKCIWTSDHRRLTVRDGTYRIRAGDVGNRIRVTCRFKRLGWHMRSISTHRTKVVQPRDARDVPVISRGGVVAPNRR